MKKILYVGMIIISIVGAVTIKKVETTKSGMLVTFKNNTGYYIER